MFFLVIAIRSSGDMPCDWGALPDPAKMFLPLNKLAAKTWVKLDVGLFTRLNLTRLELAFVIQVAYVYGVNGSVFGKTKYRWRPPCDWGAMPDPVGNIIATKRACGKKFCEPGTMFFPYPTVLESAFRTPVAHVFSSNSYKEQWRHAVWLRCTARSCQNVFATKQASGKNLGEAGRRFVYPTQPDRARTGFCNTCRACLWCEWVCFW